MTRSVPIEEVPGSAEFLALEAIDGIRVELRYASPDNFVGQDLYAPFDCAWLHRDGARQLGEAARWLAREAPGHTLLVLDALRPQRVQERLWKALEGTGLTAYLADPAIGSIHSFGMAVDLTILGPDGVELDMGTAFDDMTERSHPALEERFLAGGGLTPAQVGNRRLLRAAMSHAGWRGIGTEWWHFDCGDRKAVRAGYLRVL